VWWETSPRAQIYGFKINQPQEEETVAWCEEGQESTAGREMSCHIYFPMIQSVQHRQVASRMGRDPGRLATNEDRAGGSTHANDIVRRTFVRFGLALSPIP
jgi:hypothetical protein